MSNKEKLEELKLYKLYFNSFKALIKKQENNKEIGNPDVIPSFIDYMKKHEEDEKKNQDIKKLILKKD